MSDLGDLAARVVSWAGDGEQVEAYAVHSRDTEVRAYSGEVESLSAAESQGVGIRVVADGRQGFAYAGALDVEVLEETLAEARDNASFGSPDEHYGLAEPDGVAAPDLDLYRAELAEVPTARKVELAMELERAVLGADSRIRGIEQAEYADTVVEAAIASTTGIAVGLRRTSCFVSTYALASDGEETQTGFGFSVGRHPDELDVDRAAADAAQRATRLLGATKPAGRRVTVVLDPFVTAMFLGVLSSTLDGEAVLKGRSVFADRVGEAVASSVVTLVDDPLEPRAYGASTFDAEGLACRRNALVDGGRLQGFLHNSYTGRRTGVPSTASAVRAGFKSTPGVGARALALAPGRASQEELVAQVADGLLVQSVSGLHSGVNPVSGDFSVGAEGMLIRGGAATEPVRELTIASTLQRMLQDVVAVGADVEWLPMSATGVSLVVADVTMSGA